MIPPKNATGIAHNEDHNKDPKSDLGLHYFPDMSVQKLRVITAVQIEHTCTIKAKQIIHTVSSLLPMSFVMRGGGGSCIWHM